MSSVRKKFLMTLSGGLLLPGHGPSSSFGGGGGGGLGGGGLGGGGGGEHAR